METTGAATGSFIDALLRPNGGNHATLFALVLIESVVLVPSQITAAGDADKVTVLFNCTVMLPDVTDHPLLSFILIVYTPGSTLNTLEG